MRRCSIKTMDFHQSYFENKFSFEFVANRTLGQCIASFHDSIDKEIDYFINLSLEDKLKEIGDYKVFQINPFWREKKGKKVTELVLLDCIDKRYELVKVIDFSFSRGCRDIADECVREASAFLAEKLKGRKKERGKKLLSGDLT